MSIKCSIYEYFSKLTDLINDINTKGTFLANHRSFVTINQDTYFTTKVKGQKLKNIAYRFTTNA